MRRLLPVMIALAGVLLCAPATALAHGMVGRRDLPIPSWLFAWGAGAVLVISFVAFAVLWREPRLEGQPLRRLARVPVAVEMLCGAVGVALFALMVYAGFAGSQSRVDNVLPTFVFVVFWVGLVPVSALLGDVFRAFNPWRAVGRAAGWIGERASRGSMPVPLEYPARLGRWPAVAGLLAFGWLELVSADRDDPSTLAWLALAYAAVQWVGMGLFGVERWTDRGDAFSVYFGLFARIAPLTIDKGHLAARRPLSGLAELRWLPGTVALLCVAIAITAFDGASEGPLWSSVTSDIQQAFADLGIGLGTALQLALSVGLAAFVGLIAGFYRLGVEGMRTTAPRTVAAELSRRFAHSLVPIALAFVIAHYFSLLVFEGQAVGYLVSDPLGDGSNLFGTAAAGIDYTAVSATAVWYVQVVALVAGHAAALAVAHDRALVAFRDTKDALRSQYWMLAVMIGFTSLGLWLLSEANG